MPIRSIPLSLFSMPKQAKKTVNTSGKFGLRPDSFPVQGALIPMEILNGHDFILNSPNN